MSMKTWPLTAYYSSVVSHVLDILSEGWVSEVLPRSAGSTHTLDHILFFGFVRPCFCSVFQDGCSHLVSTLQTKIGRFMFVNYLGCLSYPLSSSFNWPFTFGNLCWIWNGGVWDEKRHSKEKEGTNRF